ncbi:hypothetical protein [Streptomyces viridochromogenes]|uniref:hypothetical protein n=1 Tax=Streptomyces viridochromogenes TaxID=1938 RepID=UPI00131A3B68|nr:hypothetical protein [Streptomyces viridochromogenes]
MTTSSTPAPVPSVALRGRSGALWPEDGSLVLEQDGVRRRIPLPTVREVRTTDGPRGVAVGLTAHEGTGPTVYRLVHTLSAIALYDRAIPRNRTGSRPGSPCAPGCCGPSACSSSARSSSTPGSAWSRTS